MNYSKTKIYKICSHLGDKIYIGSTTKDYLSQRMTAHRKSYKFYKNGNIKYGYVRSYILFDEYGVDNCYIELIEEKECTSKDEKNKIEGQYIKSLECVNKIVQGRTPKEYRDENKEILSIKKKTHYQDNKEHYTEKAKENYEKNKEKINEKTICECGKLITKRNLYHKKTKKHLEFLNKA